jgi:hypothetical protein
LGTHDVRLRLPNLAGLSSYAGFQKGDAEMTEIVFVVEQAPEGGFIARALGESIFTEADTEVELRAAVQDAVHCHFDDGNPPKVIRLHFVRDELLAA